MLNTGSTVTRYSPLSGSKPPNTRTFSVVEANDLNVFSKKLSTPFSLIGVIPSEESLITFPAPESTKYTTPNRSTTDSGLDF